MSDILNTENYPSAEALDRTSTDSTLNRVIQFRSLDIAPLGDTAKVYYDKANKKLKMWINETVKWVDLVYTSTSTSTTSSSSSSSTSVT